MAEAGTGVDVAAGVHSDKKCSYPAYLGEKLYSYYAVMKMIYVLATDANARKELMNGISQSVVADIAKFDAAYQTAGECTKLFAINKIMAFFGSEEAKKGMEQAAQCQRENYQKAHESAEQVAAKLESAFNEWWNELKKRKEDCGFLYAAATIATDVAFFVGDSYLGIKLSKAAMEVLKGCRVLVHRAAAGKYLVTFTHPRGGSVTRQFEQRALEAEFGEPDLSHSGVRTPDPDHPPAPAPVATVAQRLTNKQIGDAAEAQAVADLRAQGYNEIYQIRNGAENGVDVVGVNSSGATKTLEVKANSASLLDGQANMGGPAYAQDRLSAAALKEGGYANISDEMQQQARDALRAIGSDANPEYEVWKYKVDPNTGAVSDRRIANWKYAPGQKPKRLIFRDSQGRARVSRPSVTPPATGPPGGGAPTVPQASPAAPPVQSP